MCFRERVFTKQKIGFYERKNWLPATRQCTNISVGIHVYYYSATVRKFSPKQKINVTYLFCFFFSHLISHTGVFLLEQERYPEAAAQLIEAVALEPDDYDLTVTAATALRQAGISFKAEDMYRKAATLRPKVRGQWT